jgi:hypothetical protein
LFYGSPNGAYSTGFKPLTHQVCLALLVKCHLLLTPFRFPPCFWYKLKMIVSIVEYLPLEQNRSLFGLSELGGGTGLGAMLDGEGSQEHNQMQPIMLLRL